MTFEDTLATWLPAQRWYSGTGATIRDLNITADTTLVAGDPELRHLIISVSRNGEVARYQVLAGIRSHVPDPLRHAVMGPAGAGGTAYEALHDPELTKVLLRGMADQETIGPLHFAREPGAVIDTSLDSLVLTGEQSNTSLVYGDYAILKVLRRLFPGPNPDLEVTRALAQRGSKHVAEPFGWIEARGDGESILLAILSRYLPTASDGWSLAVTSLRDLYSGDGALRPDQAGGDFAGMAALSRAAERIDKRARHVCHGAMRETLGSIDWRRAARLALDLLLPPCCLRCSKAGRAVRRLLEKDRLHRRAMLRLLRPPLPDRAWTRDALRRLPARDAALRGAVYQLPARADAGVLRRARCDRAYRGGPR